MRIRIAAGIALAAAVAAASGACRSSAGEPVAVENAPELPADNVMYNLEEWLTKDGVRSARMTADTAYMFDDSTSIQVHGVHVILFDEEGKKSGELTARSGVVDQRTQAMTARGSVVLTLQDGNRRIETEELHYEPQADRIWSDVQTTMTENGSRVTGTGFSGDTHFQNYQIKNPRATGKSLKVTF